MHVFHCFFFSFSVSWLLCKQPNIRVAFNDAFFSYSSFKFWTSDFLYADVLSANNLSFCVATLCSIDKRLRRKHPEIIYLETSDMNYVATLLAACKKWCLARFWVTTVILEAGLLGRWHISELNLKWSTLFAVLTARYCWNRLVHVGNFSCRHMLSLLCWPEVCFILFFVCLNQGLRCLKGWNNVIQGLAYIGMMSA